MPTNTGVPYELLTKAIFQQINANTNQGIKNYQIEQNYILKGKTNQHQIDVYWRFEFGDVEYTTIVQCKDWADTVSQGDMFEFLYVLQDVPGQPRGVYVTRTGYQSGARKAGEANGILMYTLRKPSDVDLKDMVSKITLNLTMRVPTSSIPQVNADGDWLRSEYERRGIPPDTKVTFSINGPENIIWLYDAGGNRIETLQDVKNSLYPTLSEEVALQRFERTFAEPRYIDNSGDPDWPRIKIKSIAYDLAVMDGGTITTELKIDNIVGYLLEDITSGERRSVSRDLRLLTT